jgi:hypothetical protein
MRMGGVLARETSAELKVLSAEQLQLGTQQFRVGDYPFGGRSIGRVLPGRAVGSATRR